MQTVAGHDIGFAAQNAGRPLPHIHQIEKPEFAFLIVEKQVNIGIFAGLSVRGRTEQIKMFNPEPLQLGFMRSQHGNGVIAVHQQIIARIEPLDKF